MLVPLRAHGAEFSKQESTRQCKICKHIQTFQNINGSYIALFQGAGGPLLKEGEGYLALSSPSTEFIGPAKQGLMCMIAVYLIYSLLLVDCFPPRMS